MYSGDDDEEKNGIKSNESSNQKSKLSKEHSQKVNTLQWMYASLARVIKEKEAAIDQEEEERKLRFKTECEKLFANDGNDEEEERICDYYHDQDSEEERE